MLLRPNAVKERRIEVVNVLKRVTTSEMTLTVLTFGLAMNATHSAATTSILASIILTYQATVSLTIPVLSQVIVKSPAVEDWSEPKST